MMHIPYYIASPLVGGIVGLVTNWIAIKMFFWPSEAVMIGRFRVPFTPGIVPKRKDRLAEILGGSIVDKFFNADDLELVFLSEPFTNAFADAVVTMLSDSGSTLGDLSPWREAAEAGETSRLLKDELCIRLQAALLRSQISRQIAEEGLRQLQGRLGGTALGKALKDELSTLVAAPLAEKLDKYILEEGRSVILPILEDELRALNQLPVTEFTENVFPKPEVLHQLAGQLHRHFMQKHVRHIVESIDVGGIITEKVKGMSAKEIEVLVVSVVKQELNYNILLGGLIGVIIGIITIFV